MISPAYRHLRGYCLDPGFSTRLDQAEINEVVYHVPFETVEPGPVGEYLEVIDFDPASTCWYEPVDLAQERIASQNGLAPSEGNPQFHQQFVYAVGMKTLRHFERALGRKIVWYPRRIQPNGRARNAGDRRWERRYVQRLRIYPHAMRDTNAYYDPDKKALLFGYFAAADQSQGANYPGGLVFTCLSPDIVAHETTHAILDSIHHRYLEDTNPDVAAFHEGFADIVALLQRFTFAALVEDQLYRSAGRLNRYTVLGELATQFGEALEGNRGALRSMIGRWNEKGEWEPLQPSPFDYVNNVEAHDRGAVLVATIFDAFQRIYEYRTRDLIRIATNGTGVLPEGSISRDLVHRLAREASDIADHLLSICIRALDYCPSTDISFGSYLRALITADLDIAPEDENGYRLALIEAFRARGIFPDRVNTLSVESLTWNKPEFTDQELIEISWLAEELKPDIHRLVETTDREQLYLRSQAAQAKLHELLLGKETCFLSDSEWENFLNKLGLTSLPVSRLFGKDSADVRFLFEGRPNNSYIPAIEVHTVRPAFRAGRESRPVEQQVVITFTQKVTADVGSNGATKEMIFRGGCSLIIELRDLNIANLKIAKLRGTNLTAANLKKVKRAIREDSKIRRRFLDLYDLKIVKYAIVKSIGSYRRFREQASYVNGEDENAPVQSTSLYSNDDREWRLDFNLLHRH